MKPIITNRKGEIFKHSTDQRKGGNAYIRKLKHKGRIQEDDIVSLRAGLYLKEGWDKRLLPTKMQRDRMKKEA